MKYGATFNAIVALAGAITSVYTHELALAAAWGSSFFGWFIVSVNAWVGEQ